MKQKIIIILMFASIFASSFYFGLFSEICDAEVQFKNNFESVGVFHYIFPCKVKFERIQHPEK